MKQIEVASAIEPTALRISDVKEPKLLCLVVFTGGGTKLFQSYLDGHPDVYNIPAYPLIYFYPHWQTWREQFQEVWNWDTIINIFCIKHASVIDSRNIVGMNGLDKLGETNDGYVSIDAEQFRGYLKSLLRDEPVSRRAFVLAVNYAYALCKGQDLSCKKVLLWHHHSVEHLDDFMSDFPDATILATIRDPRVKIYRLWSQFQKEDQFKLNPTDTMIYQSNAIYHVSKYMFFLQHDLGKMVKVKDVIFLRHEDMAIDLRRMMKKFADLFGIRYLDLMLESSFDGKIWWGHEIYGMPDVNGTRSQSEKAKQVSQEALRRILSAEWKHQKPGVEIFIFEGMMFDFLVQYGYQPLYYKKDSWWERISWMVIALLLFEIEIKSTLFYLNPATHLKIMATAWKEAQGEIKRKYYGFNGTYLYKYNYVDLKLWRRSFIERWLDKAEKIKNKDKLSHSNFVAASIGYVLYVYARFLGATVFLPVQYFRRLKICYVTFFKRLFWGSFLTSQL